MGRRLVERYLAETRRPLADPTLRHQRKVHSALASRSNAISVPGSRQIATAGSRSATAAPGMRKPSFTEVTSSRFPPTPRTRRCSSSSGNGSGQCGSSALAGFSRCEAVRVRELKKSLDGGDRVRLIDRFRRKQSCLRQEEEAQLWSNTMGPKPLRPSATGLSEDRLALAHCDCQSRNNH